MTPGQFPSAEPPRDRAFASLAYWIPLAATWMIPNPAAALLVALAAPLLLAAAAWRPRRTSIVFHGFQSFHLLATFLLISAVAGLLEQPGNLRWAGGLGSIPLNANASYVSRVAFWIIAVMRVVFLLYLGVQTSAGRRIALPGAGHTPLPSPARAS